MQSVEKSTKPCLPKCGRINAKGGTEMINPKISRATLGRAPAYLKFLRGIEDSTANISATTIAKELELGEVQVRKDLRALCGSGKPKTGYKVGELTASLASCLSEKDGGTVIIGAGKLGRALLDYAGFADYGLNILAAFDIAVAEPVASPKGKYIYPVSELDSFCSEHNARIGIIAVPAEAAQQACNELYKSRSGYRADPFAGIKMMLCLAPCKLIPPNDTIIRYENIAQSLAVLKAQSL